MRISSQSLLFTRENRIFINKNQFQKFWPQTLFSSKNVQISQKWNSGTNFPGQLRTVLVARTYVIVQELQCFCGYVERIPRSWNRRQFNLCYFRVVMLLSEQITEYPLYRHWVISPAHIFDKRRILHMNNFLWRRFDELCEFKLQFWKHLILHLNPALKHYWMKNWLNSCTFTLFDIIWMLCKYKMLANALVFYLQLILEKV